MYDLSDIESSTFIAASSVDLQTVFPSEVLATGSLECAAPYFPNFANSSSSCFVIKIKMILTSPVRYLRMTERHAERENLSLIGDMRDEQNTMDVIA